ncbi:hypothetical protein BJ878DRAFT_295807 [Calycina marina]|uniref:Uncharacterized protein n=1 Tax=Calycina marina TaxID=1763456 RepID=A0A9P8CGY3_9HELO|nr:hypothetical protein BJ878DRAFT_295807 [Calycina marina]
MKNLAIFVHFFREFQFPITALSSVLSKITPNKRPLSLINPKISFHFVTNEKIPTLCLGLYAVLIPAVVIFFVAIITVPVLAAPKSAQKSLVWKRKFWKCHTRWLGLVLSLA